jgi:hypothetical protein
VMFFFEIGSHELFAWGWLQTPCFVMRFFQIGAHELFTQGWLQTSILLISASWVARITGMSHQHLTVLDIFEIGSCELFAWTVF